MNQNSPHLLERKRASRICASGFAIISSNHPLLANGCGALKCDTIALWRWMKGNTLLPVSTPSSAIVEIETRGVATFRVEAREAPHPAQVGAVRERLAWR